MSKNSASFTMFTEVEMSLCKFHDIKCIQKGYNKKALGLAALVPFL